MTVFNLIIRRLKSFVQVGLREISSVTIKEYDISRCCLLSTDGSAIPWYGRYEEGQVSNQS